LIRISPRPILYTANHTKNLDAFSVSEKFSHLDWLLPLLPACHHYCERFGGSAAVLLNRAPSPVETYNDIDGEVSNFFRALRENGSELVRAIRLARALEPTQRRLSVALLSAHQAATNLIS
jgi:DNA adenine methylase